MRVEFKPNPKRKRFELGQVVMTQGVAALVENGFEPMGVLLLHKMCLWGEVCRDDWDQNDRALEDGDRLMSVYEVDDFVARGEDVTSVATEQFGKVWVITEWDRSVTTILLPSEY
jgi:hypothetical protein